MLKKRKNTHAEKEQKDKNTANESHIASETAAPPVPADRGNTVIGKNIFIEGTLRGRENLIIEGSMKGIIELEQHKLTIGSTGRVEADIMAKDVTVSGHFVGNITAKGMVELTKGADFTGNIQTGKISVEDGAYIKADIDMEQPAHKDSAAPDNFPVQLVPASGKETAGNSNSTDKKDS